MVGNRVSGMAEDLSNLTVLLVGPGRAGRAFARSWTGTGGRLVVAARDPARATLPGKSLPGVEVRALGDDAALTADVLVLAAPDDALAPLAADISSRGRWRFAFHFSGAIPATRLHSVGPPDHEASKLHTSIAPSVIRSMHPAAESSL